MEVLLETARAVLFRHAHELDSGALYAELPVQVGMARAVLAKYVATNNAVQIVDRALHVVGGAGYFRRLPLERMFRDVRAGPIMPYNNLEAHDLFGRTSLGLEIAPAVPLPDGERGGGDGLTRGRPASERGGVHDRGSGTGVDEPRREHARRVFSTAGRRRRRGGGAARGGGARGRRGARRRRRGAPGHDQPADGAAVFVGLDNRAGVQAAIRELNSAGRRPRPPHQADDLRRRLEPDPGRPAHAADRRRLEVRRRDRLRASAPSSLAAAQIVAAARIPYISMASSAAQVTPAKPYFFMTTATSRLFAYSMARQLRKQGIRRIAIMGDNGGFGQEGLRNVRSLARGYGFTIVEDITFPTTATNFTSELARVKNTTRRRSGSGTRPIARSRS